MITDLESSNPWWRRPAGIQNDPQWKTFHRSRLQWRPALLDQMDLEQNAVHVLRGARQVGKSTLVKLWIDRLLSQRTDPRCILYFSCDLLSGNGELFTVMERYRAMTESLAAPRRYLFLDEVTLVSEWQYAVKKYVDMFGLEGQTVLVTGSSAMDLRRGAERMPGRRGEAARTDWMLFPLSFREFVWHTDALPQTGPTLPLRQVLEDPETLPQVRSQWEFVLTTLERALVQYLSVGGFPLAVESYLQHRMVQEWVGKTYLAVIHSDIEKQRRSRATLNDLLSRLLQTEGSPQSWQNLSRDLGSGSFHTVQEYAEILADSFLLCLIRQLDLHRAAPALRKGKKIYFADPLLRAAVCQEFHLIPPPLAMQVEAAVGMHLLRYFEQQPEEGWSSLQQLFYWRSDRGREVDFLVRQNGTRAFIPVEVKYQEQIHPADGAPMLRSFGAGCLVTKKRFLQTDRLIGLPAAVFLLLE
jgi:predicted AAA+ superfamily ATPase